MARAPESRARRRAAGSRLPAPLDVAGARHGERELEQRRRIVRPQPERLVEQRHHARHRLGRVAQQHRERVAGERGGLDRVGVLEQPARLVGAPLLQQDLRGEAEVRLVVRLVAHEAAILASAASRSPARW
jgi:hypothetical protein